MIDIHAVADNDAGHRDAPVLILESSDRAPLRSRRFVADVFAKWGIPDDFVVRLVVSELVTNAYRYGEGAIIVRVSVGGHGLPVIEVYDSGDEWPSMLPENHVSTGGRGLLTVADVTGAWGVRPVEGGGKVVWARLLP